LRSFAETVLDFLKTEKVDYGDVRVTEHRSQEIYVENGRVEIMTRVDMGFGVRVLKDGYWGFSASHDLSLKEADRVVKEAVSIAKASKIAGGFPVTLSEEIPHVDTYKTPYEEDPFNISLEEKIELLTKINQILTKSNLVKLTKLFLNFYRTKKYFASTEGALIEQEILESGGGYSVYAVKDGEFQVRSYPASHRGNYATAGYEFIRKLNLEGEAERVREEAVALLTARPTPEGEFDLILGTHQMALQIHESIGHAVELDRVLGYEASYAGTSFVTLEKLGNFRYGSEIMNVYADATVPMGLGTFGYDDEGVVAQRVPIIENGIFVGYLSSRETAPKIGRRSSGAMRAETWANIPLIRMTNINLEPGEWKLEEIIGDTEDGIFMDTNRSWSIDQERLNFQFGTEIAWRIKGGKITEMLKNPVYTGITPEFWRSMDRIADRSSWQLWGIPGCGKGEPGQTAHVGHGSSPARFRKVKVGSVKR
jgi:TldD protein